MNKQRYPEIDILRGISVLAIILIHSCVYFLKDKIAFVLWDYSQFAVAVFIFCSAYIFFAREPQINMSNFVAYLKKRLLRLLPTYYLFAFLYLVLALIFQHKAITGKIVMQNLLLIGGIDFNWLVLLFVYLTLLMPLIFFLYQKNKTLFYLTGLVSIASSVLFIFFRPANYRLTMWLPWLVIPYFTLIFLKYRQNKIFLFAAASLALIVFLVLRFTLIEGTQYQNKYPPNLYHLSYGIFALPVLYSLSRANLFNIKPVQKFILFLSSNSYTLFFIHLIIIFLITVPVRLKLSWYSFFMIVLLLALTAQIAINLLFNFKKK